MGTKADPGQYDCYGNADLHEPLFTLVGRDPTAGPTVALWVALRRALGDTDEAKLEEAERIADQLAQYGRQQGKGEAVSRAENLAMLLREALGQ